jgi:hypothetical protein
MRGSAEDTPPTIPTISARSKAEIRRRSRSRAPHTSMGEGAGARRGGGGEGGAGVRVQHPGGVGRGGLAGSGPVWNLPAACTGVRSGQGPAPVAGPALGDDHHAARGGQPQGELPGAWGGGDLGALGAPQEPLHPTFQVLMATQDTELGEMLQEVSTAPNHSALWPKLVQPFWNAVDRIPWIRLTGTILAYADQSWASSSRRMRRSRLSSSVR